MIIGDFKHLLIWGWVKTYHTVFRRDESIYQVTGNRVLTHSHIVFNHKNGKMKPHDEHTFWMAWNHHSDPVDQSQVWATNLKEEVSHSQCLADSYPGILAGKI